MENRSDEELEQVIKKCVKTKKILQKQVIDYLTKAWYLKRGLYRIKALYYAARLELGARKSAGCPALFRDSEGKFNCLARRREGFSSHDAMLTNLCCYCKLSLEEKKTRMVFNRIVEGER